MSDHSISDIDSKLPQFRDMFELKEYLEELIHSYPGQWIVDTECAEDNLNNLDAFFTYIYTMGYKLSAEESARIRYGWEPKSHLMLIYLSSDGEYIKGPALSSYETMLRSVLVHIPTLADAKVVCAQYPQILYNAEAEIYLQDEKIDWDSQVEIQTCHDGTMITIVNIDGVFRKLTRRCIDAGKSNWARQATHLELLDEVLVKDGNVLLDESQLNPDWCYSVVLVHEKNKHLVPVPEELKPGAAILIDVREKYSLKRVLTDDGKLPLIPGLDIPRSEIVACKNLEELKQLVAKDNRRMLDTNVFDTEGYVICIYNDATHRQLHRILKLQTPLYKMLKLGRPATGAITEFCLDLYKRNLLNEYLHWCKIDESYRKLVHLGLIRLSSELKLLYRTTRGHQNPILYGALTPIWKKALNDLHGLYINGVDRKPIDEEDTMCYLKALETRRLVKMLVTRYDVVGNLEALYQAGQVENTWPFHHNADVVNLADALYDEQLALEELGKEQE